MATAVEEAKQVVEQAEAADFSLAHRLGSGAMTSEEWKMIAEQSSVLAAAGTVLPQWIQSKYQVAAVLMKGRELGFQPMYALENISMVRGSTMTSGKALLALIIQRHGRKAVKLLSDPSDREKATYQFVDPLTPDDEPLVITFTIEKAQALGLVKKGGAWETQPEVMLKWRAISEGARFKFPDTIAGLYLPGEVEGTQARVVPGGGIELDVEAFLAEQQPVATQQVPVDAEFTVDADGPPQPQQTAKPQPQPQKAAQPQPQKATQPTQALGPVQREIVALCNSLQLPVPKWSEIPTPEEKVKFRDTLKLQMRGQAPKTPQQPAAQPANTTGQQQSLEEYIEALYNVAGTVAPVMQVSVSDLVKDARESLSLSDKDLRALTVDEIVRLTLHIKSYIEPQDDGPGTTTAS